MFDYAKKWEGIGGPGHWPDCDMIQIGKLSKRGPVGPERYSRFMEDELYTHINFWCIYRSPLMLGGNQPENRELELKLFTNEEVLGVNQNGENPRQSNVNGSKDLYVGLFNISENAHDASVDFAALGLKGKVLVRDLWKKADAGVFKKSYSQKINLHGSIMLRLSVK